MNSDDKISKDNVDVLELRDWLDSLDEVLARSGPERVCELLQELSLHAESTGIRAPFTANTPYVNTIPLDKQTPYPGNLEMEQRIRSYIRWNAMAMVVKANRNEDGNRRSSGQLCLGCHPAGGCLQPLSQRPNRRLRR